MIGRLFNTWGLLSRRGFEWTVLLQASVLRAGLAVEPSSDRVSDLAFVGRDASMTYFLIAGVLYAMQRRGSLGFGW